MTASPARLRRAVRAACVIVGLVLAASAQEAPAAREPGLSVRFWYVGGPLDKIMPLVHGQTPNVSRVQPVIDMKDLTVGDFDTTFMARAEGFLETDAGAYELRLTSDDGAILKLDGQIVLDHDGLHAESAVTKKVELKKGLHALDLWFFQCYGGWTLRLEWKPPGASAFTVVPVSALSCQAGEVRVTAPGPKRVLRPLARTRPGDGQPLDALNPALSVATIRPPDFQPRVGGIAFLADGRMLITTWDEVGAVWILDGVESGDAAKVKVKRFAAGLAEPLGIAVVGSRVFVLQKQELTELVDTDGDGVADEYKDLCSAWNVSGNFHEFAFGLVEKDGWLYFNLAIAIDPGGRSTRPQVPGRGSALRVKIADGTMETIANGLRTPNGIGIGVGGDIFITDNQGDWLPSSKLLHLEKGAFFGSRSVLLEAAAKLAVTPPVLWMPQNEIGNSPSNPTLIPAGWGPFSGQMCHGDVTHGGIKRDVLEVVDGVWQGCIIDWTQGLECGVNRIAFGPDGALYVGGIGSTGNWGQEGKLHYGLQRVVWHGPPAFEILAMRAKTNGFEVELTRPIAPGRGWEKENWDVQQWRYVPTEEYGGPKVDEETLAVRSVSISADRRKAFLEIEGMKPDHVVALRIVGPVVDESGAALGATQAWYTLNRIPKADMGFHADAPAPAPQNVLTDAERAAGWKLLFDGKTTTGWHTYGKKSAPSGWQAVDGALSRASGGGDIATDEDYADFELALEWRISPGGNSGIMFHVDESLGAPWESGPEMQVLDNQRHPDGHDPTTSAGSAYALYAPPRDLTNPVGMWNQVRLRVKGSHVEQWLNGTLCCTYELGSPEWKTLVSQSKFASMPRYGQSKTGRICLQDHGDAVAYRNVRVRRL
jgi:cytochrome c